MSLTVAHISKEPDVSAVKVVKDLFPCMAWRYIAKYGGPSPNKGLREVLQIHLVSSLGDEMSIWMRPFEKSETVQNYLILVVLLGC